MAQIKYPTGISHANHEINQIQHTYQGMRNLGMDLEDNIIKSCEYYYKNNRASIHKRPTPIKIMKVDSGNSNLILEAKFNQKSTTDFVGVYRGKYIDFECKKSKEKSFPFKNFAKHQIEHMIKIEQFGAVSFFVIHMEYYNKVFVVNSREITSLYLNEETSSLSIKRLEDHGIVLQENYIPKLNFLDAVDKIFFKTPFDKHKLNS